MQQHQLCNDPPGRAAQDDVLVKTGYHHEEDKHHICQYHRGLHIGMLGDLLGACEIKTDPEADE